MQSFFFAVPINEEENSPKYPVASPKIVRSLQGKLSSPYEISGRSCGTKSFSKAQNRDFLTENFLQAKSEIKYPERGEGVCLTSMMQ